jgi:Domain of unknown function (DUF4440)
MRSALLLRTAVVASLLLLQGTTGGRREELSRDQRDVWETIEGLWRAWQQQDVEKVLAYIHPDYSSWNYSEATPGTFSRADAERSFKARSVTTYNLTLLGVKVYKTFAFVHYRYSGVIRSKSDGQEQKVDGRYTDPGRAARWPHRSAVTTVALRHATRSLAVNRGPSITGSSPGWCSPIRRSRSWG